MDALETWAEAPLFILSCPGPLRRHEAALSRISAASMSQVLLGYEAQLLAFAASLPAGMARRTFFSPAPEFYGTEMSRAMLWQGGGRQVRPISRAVHIRFGGSRSVRVIKGARNAAVIAENHGYGLLATGAHPFASGLSLPAAVGLVLTYAPDQALPAPIGGGRAAYGVLPPETVGADMEAATARRTGGRGSRFDLVSLPDFRSAAWAAGAALQDRAALANEAHFVLLPWNVEHAGSIVPELITRLLRLAPDGGMPVRCLVLPFNYPGQTGILRRTIVQLRSAARHAHAPLDGIFFGRLTRHGGLAELRRRAPVAWVDGNDPEYGWTLRRLAAAGFRSVLLDPAPARALPPGTAGAVLRVTSSDDLRLDPETRWGRLHMHVRAPSFGQLRHVLDATERLRSAG